MSSDNVLRLFGEPQTLSGRMPNRAEVMMEWQRRRHDLMNTANWAEQFAYSYRPKPKHYGVALLVCRSAERLEDRFGITFGSNCTIKPRRKDAPWPKPCGEWSAWMDAHGQGFTQIGAVVVFTNHTQADDMSGVICSVQQPCYECREMFLAASTPDWVPVVSFRNRLPCDFDEPGDKRLVIQESTFGEVLQLHHHQSGQRH